MSHYIKASAVKKVFKDSGKQLSKDGLFAIDVKIGEFLEKCCKQFNGHHKRITASLINLIKLSIMILLMCGQAYAVEIDDNLVQAMIMAESSGNPNAVSPCGAVGLLQITPVVLKEYNQEFIGGYAPAWYHYEDLFDPKINVKIGTWYLNRIKDHYLKGKGTLDDVLICYNWGIGNWRNWNKTRDFKKLPKETRDYIKRVKSYMKGGA